MRVAPPPGVDETMPEASPERVADRTAPRTRGAGRTAPGDEPTSTNQQPATAAYVHSVWSEESYEKRLHPSTWPCWPSQARESQGASIGG